MFNEIKNRLDIEEVAQRYGTEIKRGFALCPFHADSNPSMSFKYNRFKCWACGASGSVIDFVALKFNIKPLEAAKMLNQDFGLNLEIGKPILKQQIKQIEKDNKLYDAFMSWENDTYKTLTVYYRQLSQYKRDYLPASPEETPNACFIEALQNMDYIEYLLDFLLTAKFEQKLDFFKSHKKWVSNIADKTRQDTNAQRAG